MFARPSRLSGSDRETLPDVQEWSGDPPGCSGVVGWPTRMSGSGRETLPDVLIARETLPDVQEWSEILPNVPEW